MTIATPVFKGAPASRIRVLNDRDPDPGKPYVLYWMTTARRTGWNHALDHAVHLASTIGKPLVVFEALGLRYPYPSVRHHQFVLDGMAENAAALRSRGATVLTAVATRIGSTKNLLHTLSAHSCAVITDETAFPFLRGLARQAARAPVHAVAVDSIGTLPLSAATRAFPTAHSFRRHLQKSLPAHLHAAPHPDPLGAVDLPGTPVLPDLSPWASVVGHNGLPDDLDLASLPLDHSVGATACRGGSAAAVERWRDFLESRLDHYADGRNHPDDAGSSGLSPWLHHGHFSTFQALSEIGERYDWHPDMLTPGGRGSRTGWWGLPAGPEAFLDEIITWREVGQVFAWHEPVAHEWDTLPAWARTTLDAHANDPRPETYDRETLEAADTADPIWNAAQRELVRTGRMHNYLRMLWGKKVLQWSDTPQQALETLLYLNDKYALDGRDPNTLAGVGWVFGRFDRAWGPERPIFGKTRYMTSDSTARKLRLRRYLERWGPAA